MCIKYLVYLLMSYYIIKTKKQMSTGPKLTQLIYMQTASRFCLASSMLAYTRRGGSALWEPEAGGSLEVRSSRPTWPTWWNPVSTKNTKISQAWWHRPVIPATWEAEAGESLEPGRWRLQWAKIVPLHTSLGNRARVHLKKKRERERVKGYILYDCIYVTLLK